MDITSGFKGITTPIAQLYQEVEQRGWTVQDVSLKDGQYSATIKNPYGETVEKVGRTPETALGAALIHLVRKEHIRASSIRQGAWKNLWTHKLPEIARSYAEAPVFDPKAAPAWRELADDSRARADHLRKQLHIEVTDDPEPYHTPQEMAEDIHKNKHFNVSRANSEHPLWSEDDNVNFRIVHDVMGHAVAGGDFGWHGENLACGAHFPLLSPQAQRALFTECVGQSAYGAQYRGFGPQKITFMDDHFLPTQAQENKPGHMGLPIEHTFAPSSMPVHAPSEPVGFSTDTVAPHEAEELGYQNGYDHNRGMPAMVGLSSLGSDEKIMDKGDGWKLYHLVDGQWVVKFDPELGEGHEHVALQDAYDESVGNPINHRMMAGVERDPNFEYETHIAPPYPNAYLSSDPLGTQDQKQVAHNLDTGWSQWESRDQQKQAIVNAFRAALLSPMKNLKWNAVHYQDISHIPASVSDPKVYWDTLSEARKAHNKAQGVPDSDISHKRYYKALQEFYGYYHKHHPDLDQAQVKEAVDRQIMVMQAEEFDNLHTQDKIKDPDMEVLEPKIDKAIDKRLKEVMKDNNGPRFAAVEDPPNPYKRPERYGGFMANHLIAISKVSQYADRLLDAALEDVKTHNGAGWHFRHQTMKLEIPFVGPKVASFVWLLLQPMTSQLATIDTHMMDVLGRTHKKDMTTRDYFKYERMLQAGRDASGYENMPLGQFQWAMWDTKRTGPGTHQDHSPLKAWNPEPHGSHDWHPPVAPGAAKGTDWEAPAWWAATENDREAEAAHWDHEVAPDYAKSKIPWSDESVPMPIVANSDDGLKIVSSPDGKEWIVTAPMYGSRATVFGPASVFECTEWVAKQEHHTAAASEGTEDELHLALGVPQRICRTIGDWVSTFELPEEELVSPSEYHITVAYSEHGLTTPHVTEVLRYYNLTGMKFTAKRLTKFDDGALVVELEADKFSEVAEKVAVWLEERGIEVSRHEGGWKPHITVAYTEDEVIAKLPPLIFRAGGMSFSTPRKAPAFAPLTAGWDYQDFKPEFYELPVVPGQPSKGFVYDRGAIKQWPVNKEGFPHHIAHPDRNSVLGQFATTADGKTMVTYLPKGGEYKEEVENHLRDAGHNLVTNSDSYDPWEPAIWGDEPDPDDPYKVGPPKMASPWANELPLIAAAKRHRKKHRVVHTWGYGFLGPIGMYNHYGDGPCHDSAPAADAGGGDAGGGDGGGVAASVKNSGPYTNIKDQLNAADPANTWSDMIPDWKPATPDSPAPGAIKVQEHDSTYDNGPHDGYSRPFIYDHDRKSLHVGPVGSFHIDMKGVPATNAWLGGGYSGGRLYGPEVDEDELDAYGSYKDITNNWKPTHYQFYPGHSQHEQEAAPAILNHFGQLENGYPHNDDYDNDEAVWSKTKEGANDWSSRPNDPLLRNLTIDPEPSKEWMDHRVPAETHNHKFDSQGSCEICGISFNEFQNGSAPYGDTSRSVDGPIKDPVADLRRSAGLMESFAEPVDPEKLLPFREWDWSAEHNRDGSEAWQKLKEDVAQNGFREPAFLHYNPETGKGYVGEGNHRIGIAKELGIPVPTVLYRMFNDDERYKPIVENPEYEPYSFGQYEKPSKIGLAATTHTSSVWADDWFKESFETPNVGPVQYKVEETPAVTGSMGIFDTARVPFVSHPESQTIYMGNPGQFHDDIHSSVGKPLGNRCGYFKIKGKDKGKHSLFSAGMEPGESRALREYMLSQPYFKGYDHDSLAQLEHHPLRDAEPTAEEPGVWSKTKTAQDEILTQLAQQNQVIAEALSKLGSAPAKPPARKLKIHRDEHNRMSMIEEVDDSNS